MTCCRLLTLATVVTLAAGCSTSHVVGLTGGTGASATGASTGQTTSSTSGSANCCSSACCSIPSTATSTNDSGALICQDGTACYGGWYCQLIAAGGGACSEADPCGGQSGTWSCGGETTSSSGASGTTSGSSGQASSGAVSTSSGGSVSLTVPALSFGVIGDTRPRDACTATPCTSYPTAVIDALYSDLTGFSPQVSFVVTTGDYQYNTPGVGTAAWQVEQYAAAASIFTDGGRPVYPTMGNHECTGYTDSNCGPNGSDGITENFTAFLSDLLGPLGLPNGSPYYAVTVTIAGGQTAKFLMVAANAWDSNQQSWLTSALASKTTYTFIVQHESNNLDQEGTSAPSSLPAIRSVVEGSGTPASGEIYPVTLWIVGHTHNYDYDSANQQVINGLGGATKDQLETGESSSTFYDSDYAYMVCAQQSSGTPPALQCDLYDYATNAATNQSFAVNADGTAATVQ